MSERYSSDKSVETGSETSGAGSLLKPSDWEDYNRSKKAEQKPMAQTGETLACPDPYTDPRTIDNPNAEDYRPNPAVDDEIDGPAKTKGRSKE